MIFFIRNKENRTIVDCEVYIKEEDGNEFIELHSVICIDYYSEFLLKNQNQAKEIIQDFNALQSLRGWLWESFFAGTENNPKEYDNVIIALTERFLNIAKKYNLMFITD